MKIINIVIVICFSFGNPHFDYPQHSNNLARWNGGSALSSVYQQLNPASILMENHFSISMKKLPESIYSQNFIITRFVSNNILKINMSILDYGQFEDFITKNSFTAKDVIVGLSVKRKLKKLISLGVQLNYLNSKIDNFSENIIKGGIGLRTHLMEKRLGLGIAIHRYFNLNHSKLNETSDVIFGLFYKPLYFPGEIAVDIVKNNQLFGILSANIKFHKYLTVIFGMTSEKFEFHNGSTFNNIFYGLSSGIEINLKNYKFNFGIRNIGQFGNIAGISLGYNY